MADLPHLCGEYDICRRFLFLLTYSQSKEPDNNGAKGYKSTKNLNNQISQSRMHTAEDVFIRDLPDTQVIGNQSRADREGA